MPIGCAPHRQHLRDGFLGDGRSDIASAFLAAADEEGPADVPILKAARAAIVDEWETFENAYVQQDPSSILRAVTLDAVRGGHRCRPAGCRGSLVHASQ